MNIYLIGMMGSGKSTVGKILAKKMDMPFVDLDHYIEVRTKKSISDIFKEDGESRFRALEAEGLSDIENSKVMVSCGGGIILSKSIREKLQSTGKVVFLKTPIPELAGRLRTTTDRPLLHEKQGEKELNNIWNDRKHLYEKTAHFTVQIDRKSPEEISEDIIKKIHS